MILEIGSAPNASGASGLSHACASSLGEQPHRRYGERPPNNPGPCLTLSLLVTGIAANDVDDALAPHHFAVLANPLHAGSDLHVNLLSLANWRGKAPQYKPCDANLPRALQARFRLLRRPAIANRAQLQFTLVWSNYPESPHNPNVSGQHPPWREGNRTQNNRSSSSVGPAVRATGPDSVMAIVCSK